MSEEEEILTWYQRDCQSSADYPHFPFEPHLEPFHNHRLNRLRRQQLGAGDAAVVDEHQGRALSHSGPRVALVLQAPGS